MKVKLLLTKGLASVQKNGLMKTLGKAVEYARPTIADDPFDLRNGTDTAGEIPLWRLSVDSPADQYGCHYKSTPEAQIKSDLALLAIDFAGFTFCDLGCGKGRALLVADVLGFGQVIGVEFAAELVQTARNNIAITRSRATVEHGDAGAFWMPAGPLVVYMYNPFEAPVMMRVIDRMRAHDGMLCVVYRNPRCAELLDNSGFLTRTQTFTNLAIWKYNKQGESN